MNYPFECFKVYLGLKNHFTTNYDFIKYKGKTNTSEKYFQTRKDKFLFEKLSKILPYDYYIPFFISQFVYNIDVSISNIIDNPSKTQKTFNIFKNNLTNIIGNLQADMRRLSIDSNYSWINILSIEEHSSYPLLFNRVFQNKIKPESYSILVNILQKKYPELERDSLYQKIHFKFFKYRTFLKINNEDIFKFVRKDLTFFKD